MGKSTSGTYFLFGEPARGGCGSMDGALHQAGVDVCQPEAATVLNIPDLVIGDQLSFLQIFRQITGLFDADLCQRGVGAFLVVRVVPISVVLRLSVTDEVEFHIVVALYCRLSADYSMKS